MRSQLSTKNQSGFVVVATLLAIAVLAGASGTLLLLNSYKAEYAAREFAARVELDAIDQDLKRSAANTLLSSLQTSAGGQFTLPSSVTRTGAAMALVTGAKDAQAKFDSLATTLSNATGNLLSVSAWSPTATGYTTNTPPSGVFAHQRGSIVSKVMSVDVARTANIKNNLISGENGRAADTGAFRIRIYEIPSQTWAAAGDNISIDNSVQLSTAGSVWANNLDLNGASIYFALVTDDLKWTSGSRIGGRQLTAAKSVANAGQKLAKDLERGVYGAVIAPDRVSVLRGHESAFIAQLGDHGTTSDGGVAIPNMLLPKATPTNWDAYCLPYYQTSLRISAQVNAAKTEINNVTVSVYNTATLSGRMGSPTSTYNIGTLTVGGPGSNGLSARINNSGRVLLQVDPTSLPGGDAARAIYADIRSVGGSRTSTDAGVLLSHIEDISSLGGFSIVTPNTLALEGKINTSNSVPMSVMAREVLFGNASNTDVIHTGQMSRWTTGNGINLAEMKNDQSGGAPTSKTLNWADITDPLRVPPVTAKQWLVVTE